MSIVISNAFKVIEDRPVTSSHIVADCFGKLHKNVMRDIRSLIEQNPEFDNQLNFEPVEYVDAKGETRPEYLMDQKGFCILAMGFTGAKALEFKCAFYDEFERMKNELEAPTTITPRRTAPDSAGCSTPGEDLQCELPDDLPCDQGAVSDSAL